ncbi:MAG: T9SS type A sorting domain-containing protein [Flavobacteriales bacterium]
MLRKNVFMLGFCLITSSFVLAKIFYSDLSIVGKQGEIIGFLIKDPPDSNDLSIDDSTGTEGEWVPDDSTGTEGEWVPEDSTGTEGEWVPDDSTGTEGEWVPDDSTGNNGDKLLGVINNSNGLNFGFSIFPNPASNEINLDFKTTKTDNLSVQIVSHQGQIIESYKVTKVDVFKVSLVNLPEGRYFIRTINGSNIQTRPFVKY